MLLNPFFANIPQTDHREEAFLVTNMIVILSKLFSGNVFLHSDTRFWTLIGFCFLAGTSRISWNSRCCRKTRKPRRLWFSCKCPRCHGSFVWTSQHCLSLNVFLTTEFSVFRVPSVQRETREREWVNLRGTKVWIQREKTYLKMLQQFI